MEKIDKNIKAKLLLLFFFSNLSVYMMATTNHTSSDIKVTPSIVEYREGYVEYRIAGKLYTQFDYNKPITILGRTNQVVVPHAILKTEINQEGQDLQEISPSAQTYIIYLPSKLLPKLLSSQNLKILPYATVYQQAKRKGHNYEILL